MLKQKITDIASIPLLHTLRTMVVAKLGHIPERLEAYRLTHSSYFASLAELEPAYVFETPDHMTPPFHLLGDSVVEMEHSEDHGSIALLDLPDAASLLAAELAEVA